MKKEVKGTKSQNLEELIKKSYKKLKCSAYFDRSNPMLREQIVEFEGSCQGKIDSKFQNLAAMLCASSKVWDCFAAEELSKITAHCYPKKVNASPLKETPDNKAPKNGPMFITNASSEDVRIEEFQYMGSIPVPLHILGVLWLLLVGYKVDDGIYDKSYGNRIRKKLRNEFSGEPTFSPYLFEPYFVQYQSWRDSALEDAKKCLHDGQDVVILTLDLRRYYYSIDITPKVMDAMTAGFLSDDPYFTECQRLNRLIADICSRYSNCVDHRLTDERSVAPIGFLPSNVIANWYLSKFDRAISNGWNPVYYGRYVDDILIVDKVEKNSDIYKKARDGALSPEEIIQFFLLQCSKWNGLRADGCKKEALLYNDDAKPDAYGISPQYLPENANPKIQVQNQKVKIFYFSFSESDALLRCFQTNIAHNVSEFRFMPEESAAFERSDYGEIYELNQKSINKLRDVQGISVDKFSLSKFLGKYLRIGGMIQDDNEKAFERDLPRIMNPPTTIENYIAWEKIVEILVVNEQFDTLSNFCKNTLSAIDSIKAKTEESSENCSLPPNAKESLRQVLLAALHRGLSLCWKESVNRFIDDFRQDVSGYEESAENGIPFDLENLSVWRVRYLRTRMSDKASMAVLPDILLPSTEEIDDSYNINLTHFSDILHYLGQMCFALPKEEESNRLCNLLKQYCYYPYMVTMSDLSITQTVLTLLSGNIPIPASDYDEQWKIYLETNYRCPGNKAFHRKYRSIHAFSLKFEKNTLSGNRKGIPDDFAISVIRIGEGKLNKLKIALANVRLDEKDFYRVLDENPGRSYRRYSDLTHVVNEALSAGANMLVMPEAYVPFEWLSTLARSCARNQLAVVTGVEHLVIDKTVYNLTATILPFSEDDYRCAQIFFHLKNHYAPFELEAIQSVRLKAPESHQTGYELFCWNDCWFPVYCCYELCSIRERALFQAYADFIVAVEWNKDVNHYSNVLESLGRDLHCYCVQVNSSNYGDSRILSPTKTEEKDIVRTKGGLNPTVLADTIDIQRLRDFQFGLKKDRKFKPIPPLFDISIIAAKRKHQLFEKLRENPNDASTFN